MKLTFIHFFLLILIILFPSTQTIASGVDFYTGNSSIAGSAIATQNSATAVVTVGFKSDTFIAMGLYDASGVNTNPVFSSPTNNFPLKTTFSANESRGVLSEDSISLNSKFDLDGYTSIEDAQVIVNAMNTNSSIASDDVLIKGAIFTNKQGGNINLRTNVNSVRLTGGSGAAPVYVFRAVAGIPGASNNAITSTNRPASSPIRLNSNRRNSKGYSRFLLVGDLDERSVNLTTKGNWSATITLTVTGI